MLFDCQQETKHMLAMGARSIKRVQFCDILEQALLAGGVDIMNFASYESLK